MLNGADRKLTETTSIKGGGWSFASGEKKVESWLNTPAQIKFFY